MAVFTSLQPRSQSEIEASEVPVESPVDMTPWAHAKRASWAIVATTVLIYLGLTALAA